MYFDYLFSNLYPEVDFIVAVFHKYNVDELQETYDFLLSKGYKDDHYIVDGIKEELEDFNCVGLTIRKKCNTLYYTDLDEIKYKYCFEESGDYSHYAVKPKVLRTPLEYKKIRRS